MEAVEIVLGIKIVGRGWDIDSPHDTSRKIRGYAKSLITVRLY